MNMKGTTRDLCGDEMILYLDCMVVTQILPVINCIGISHTGVLVKSKQSCLCYQR